MLRSHYFRHVFAIGNSSIFRKKGLIRIDILIWIALIIAVVWLLKPQRSKETAQELFDFKDITPEGIIELPGNKFRFVIEIEPINLNLRSHAEQANVWMALNNMLNSLNIPCSFLVQTRYIDMQDYFKNYREKAQQQPQAIKKYGLELIEWLNRETEGQNLRDQKLFIILKTDATSSEGLLQSDNPLLSKILTLLPSKTQTISQEIGRLAAEELTETAGMISSSLRGVEINTNFLDRHGVLEMLYQTFNRDIASFARLEEMEKHNVFELFMDSETPDRILRKDVV